MRLEGSFISEGRFCIEERARSCALVIFGASGDLTSRKLIPALYKLFQRSLLSEKFYILGVARTQMSEDDFRNKLRENLGDDVIGSHHDDLARFMVRIHYISGDYEDAGTYLQLKHRLTALDQQYGAGKNHIFYMATPPPVLMPVVENLSEAGLVSECEGDCCARVVVEKPFGSELESALKLDKSLHGVLNEDQIYRIDHYLGKETVQNIMMFRFANSMFEPIWNRKYIDHVQITMAESVGIGARAGYYDRAGLLRDVFQNHMLQMLSLVAMEQPSSFSADPIRDEKVKIFKAIEHIKDADMVKGQYSKGIIDDEGVLGYGEENGVDPESTTETFVAAKLHIHNRRWKGVPFYLRAGKRLPKRLSEIAIFFKAPERSIFKEFISDGTLPNALILNIQPEEGIDLIIQAKHPGPKLCMGTLKLDFKYREDLGVSLPDAYERLLLDCMLGDQTLFVRSDGMEMGWKLLEPVLKRWYGDASSETPLYNAGTWGPKEADELIQRDGRTWRRQ